MITGRVTPDREAIVRLRLHGPKGREVELDAVLDTGFTEYLTLPRASIAALSLPQIFTDDLVLADDSIVPVELYECQVDWNGQRRAVLAHCMEGSPLVGMLLLYDHLLTMHVMDNGHVMIDVIP